MIGFLARRLAGAVLVLLAVSLLAFLAFRSLGDPVDMMLPEQATRAERDALRERLGADLPAVAQFARFVTAAVRGDFGVSYRNQRDVGALLAERAPASVELVLVSTLLALLIGVPLGVIAAVHRRSPWSDAIMPLSLVGVSLPSFAVAILLVLAFSVGLGWFPAYGRGETIALGAWWTTGLLTPSGRASLVLPAVSLALFQATLILRLVRSQMLEVLESDFVRAAWARGLPARVVRYRHALRHAVLPVATLTGMQVGTLIAFALVTETVFQWPGLGMLLLQSLLFVDVPVMAAYLLLSSALIVGVNAAIDVGYALADPRLRKSGGGGRPSPASDA